MIKALIFDCFGVLATEAWLPFKAQYFGYDSELLQNAGDLSKQANAGLLEYGSFISQIAEMAQVPAETVDHAIRSNAPNEPLFKLIAQLKPQYKIGVLSNAAHDRLQAIVGAEHYSLFDATALSFEMGVIKPDTRAYEIIAERLNVPMEACVFVDDQERLCTAAREAGMQAIWYQDFEQFEAELNEILATNPKN